MGHWRISDAEISQEQLVRFEYAYGGGPDPLRKLENNPVGAGHGLEYLPISDREQRAPQLEFQMPSYQKNLSLNTGS